MKAFFTIILLMLASAGFCQREYTHENKGINIFLEADGNGNRNQNLYGKRKRYRRKDLYHDENGNPCEDGYGAEGNARHRRQSGL